MASISKRVSGEWQNSNYYNRGTATDTIISLPAIIYGDGTNATVSVYGNTTQFGTPTPDSPVMPQGTGERMGNLFDKDKQAGNIYVTETVTRYGVEIPVSAGTYSIVGGTNRLFVKEKYGTTYGTAIDTSAQRIITLPQNGYILVYAGTKEDYTVSNIMLNSGSTALPYEPYGIKIPILSNSTTTPVYLGEVETTRKIKKLVLDGTETITEESTNVYSIPITDTVTTGTGLSTHFEYDSTVSVGQFRIEAGKAVFGYNDTLANFSTFLAAQYAAGTPVCVWYVLAEPETGIVNEPLMKIEDYADVVNNISIPTTDGANTLSVDTTVQPSEVSVNYHGWHMGTVHERTAGQWD